MASTSSQRSNSSASKRRGTRRSTASTNSFSRASSRRSSSVSGVSSRRAKTNAPKKKFSPLKLSFKKPGKPKVSAPAASRRRSASTKRSIPFVKIGIGVGVVAVLAIIAFVVVGFTPVFSIDQVEAPATDHLTSEQIGKMAEVPQGSTLFNVNQKAIEDNLKKNPWVGSVSFVRKFPHTLEIDVKERAIKAIVLMGPTNVAWYLGDDGAWIEPVVFEKQDDKSQESLALDKAKQLGCFLITQAPASIEPQAGAEATDDTIKCVLTYLHDLSPDFVSQIVSFAVPSKDSLSLMLKSGVEVSMGAPTDIATKEAVVKKILEEHPNQITYINCRVPSNPSYRKLDGPSVQAGSGS